MNTLNFEGFDSLEDFREFVRNIPDEGFCKGITGNGRGGMCVIGHINNALHGHSMYRMKNGTPWKYDSDYKESTVFEVLDSLDVDAYELVKVNNSHGSPKINLLAYIDGLISGNSKPIIQHV